MLQDGETYENSAIMQWFEVHGTSPVTNGQMAHQTAGASQASCEQEGVPKQQQQRAKALHSLRAFYPGAASLQLIIAPAPQVTKAFDFIACEPGDPQQGHAKNRFRVQGVPGFQPLGVESIIPINEGLRKFHFNQCIHAVRQLLIVRVVAAAQRPCWRFVAAPAC